MCGPKGDVQRGALAFADGHLRGPQGYLGPYGSISGAQLRGADGVGTGDNTQCIISRHQRARFALFTAGQHQFQRSLLQPGREGGTGDDKLACDLSFFICGEREGILERLPGRHRIGCHIHAHMDRGNSVTNCRTIGSGNC